ncbi:MAG: hypothetical protein HY694_12200 [Deltaproteobacteria bacterium]|nr:hypothetical protein [Deltaproteobacteria bacterium]
MLYARAFRLRNCGRFTHISSDFGSQYHTHTFVTSEALYASLTREVTWRHESKFVELERDALKSASGDYFFCDYDVAKKPIWFTPGVFVDEQLRPLPKQRGVVDKNDFNVVDEGYPSTGGRRVDGAVRQFFCPTYGRIEGVLPDHRMITCALSSQREELQAFTVGQTFLMGKKRTMFQIVDTSTIYETVEEPMGGETPFVQVRPERLSDFEYYEIMAATARYLMVRGMYTKPVIKAEVDNRTIAVPKSLVETFFGRLN